MLSLYILTGLCQSSSKGNHFKPTLELEATNSERDLLDYRLSDVTRSVGDDEDLKYFGLDLREKQSIWHGVNTLSFQMINQKVGRMF